MVNLRNEGWGGKETRSMALGTPGSQDGSPPPASTRVDRQQAKWG